MKNGIMFVSTILVLGICVLVSWLLVPYVCAGLEMNINGASFLVNVPLFAVAICALLYFARTKGVRALTIIFGICIMIFSSQIAFVSRGITQYGFGKEGFIVDAHWSNRRVYKPNGNAMWNNNLRRKNFNAKSPNGTLLVSMCPCYKYKEDSDREPEKIIVYAEVYDYDGNKLSEEEYDYNYDENFELNEDRIKYIKMRLRVDKNIYLRHQIN